MQQENVRALAATILKRLLDGSGSLSFHLARHKEHKDYSLLQEICFGSCRSYYALEFLVDELLDKPIKKKDGDIKCLLIVGIYQLKELSIPDHAVLNETVSATQELIDTKKKTFWILGGLPKKGDKFTLSKKDCFNLRLMPASEQKLRFIWISPKQ